MRLWILDLIAAFAAGLCGEPPGTSPDTAGDCMWGDEALPGAVWPCMGDG